MTLRRLLFASVHGYVDPSSGAACATRDILELLAACGVECRVLSTGVLDYDDETSPGPLIAALGGPAEPAAVALAGGGSAPAHDFTLGGVRVTLLATRSSLIARSPDRAETGAFLDLAGQSLKRFRPQVLLTYGGHPANFALMAHARRAGVPVVFHLHNLSELLVVEGRGKADGLAGVKLDLSELRNLSQIPNIPKPRAIYRQTRALLVPSLVPESFGRVAAEALANGIPVLASDRGALPETLGDAGFVFTLPERCTPRSGAIPTPREVAPWLATIERLWDDPAWESAHQARALEAARRFDAEHLAQHYLGFFASMARAE